MNDVSPSRPAASRSRSGRSPRPRVLVRALLGLAILVGCEDVVVNTVPVMSVTVTPATAEIFVGETVQLSARLLGTGDDPLSGREVTWRSSATSVATVDATGLVRGVGGGEAEITATSEGQSGSATVSVLRLPRIELDRGSVAFSATQGARDPAPVQVGIANGGDGSLDALSQTTSYDGVSSGWLDVELGATTAPTTMTLTARTGSLGAGTYSATVSVSDPDAVNGPVNLDVTFQVRQDLPTAPSSLQASEVSGSAIVLTWSDNSDDETAFRMERQAPGETAFSELAVLDPDATTYEDLDVAPDGRYVYRVRACSGAGCSPFSNQAAASTPPVPPSGLSATATGNTSADLAWTDNSATETSFRIERRRIGTSFVRIADLGADIDAYADADLDPGTTYEYRVQACNAGGCSVYSSPASVSTPSLPIPALPSGLTATTVTEALEIDLAWTDNSDDETSFQIQRRASGESDFSPLTAVSAGTTVYTDGSVGPDGTYVYRVRACGSSGCSAFSNTATASTAPSAPTSLSATAASNRRIDVAWTDNSATESSFRVERKTGAGSFVQIATPGADMATYTDVGLDPATEYSYRVRACNAGGCSDYSNTATATTLTTPAPAAPTGLSATLAAGATRADLAWTDNSSDETSFRVERSVDGATFADVATLEANATTYSDAGLSTDHLYTYRVEACGAGGCSAYSNEASVVTPPVAPTGLSATPVSTSSIDLTWADASGTEEEFRIQRSSGGSAFTQVGTAVAEATTFTDTGLDPGTAYTYRVLACNAGGCSPASGEADTATPLVAPSGLSATATSATAIDLVWTDNSANETGFRIERASGAGDFAQIATAGPGVTTYVDEGLAPGVTYAYRVRSCNVVACSDYSAEASATTGLAPAAPSGLTAAVDPSGDIELAWTDNSADETEFRIERAVGTGGFSTLITVSADVVAYTDASTSEDTGYSYRVLACNGGACSAPSNVATATTLPSAASGLSVSTLSDSELRLSWTDNSDTETEFRIERRTGTAAFALLIAVGADVTTYDDTGLTPAETYDYRVIACGDAGCATPSSIASGTTSDVAPAAPDGLSATATATTEIGLTWTDNADNETRFEIQRKIGGGSFNLRATLGANTTSYTDTGLSTDTEYSYRVRACNGDGCSAYSGTAVAVTVPTAPSELSATAVSNSRIDIAWKDNSATESSFRVERRTGGASFTEVAITGASVTTFSSTSLAQSTAYDFRVRSCNPADCSAYTDVASATTLATPPPADPTGLTATLAGDESSVALSWTDNATDETSYRVQRSVDGGTFTDLGATLAANSTNYTDTGISGDNLYAYRVEACSAAGCSGFSNEASVVTTPSAPSGLTADYAAGQVDLAWSDNSDVEVELRIQRRVDGGAFTALTTLGADVESYTDATVAEDAVYGYRVSACNSAGECSAFSNTASATTPPSAATGLSASAASDTEIDVDWTDNSDVETGYELDWRVDGTTAWTTLDLGANTDSFSHTGRTGSTTYEYQVRACNGSGCSASTAIASATTETTPPAAPGALAASVVSPTQVNLSWSDVATETSYLVERSAGSGYTTIGTPAANATSFNDTGAADGTDYTYRVSACNAGGCTPSTTTATTPVAPPTGLGASTVSDTRIDLSWTDNSGAESAYELDWRVDGTTTWTTLDLGANVESYQHTGRTPSTPYEYRVRACDGADCSTYDGVVSATTNDPPAPAAPGALAASVVSPTQVNLSWSDVATETGYLVERSAGAGYTTIGTPAANATSFNDTGAADGTDYTYRVSACNAGGCTPATTTASTPIAPPTGLGASTVSDTRIDLSWTDNSGAESAYELDWRVDGGTTWTTVDLGSNVESYSHTGRTPNTLYEYRVRACDGAECSDYDGVVSASTDATPAPAAPGALAASVVSPTQVNLSWTDVATEDNYLVERSDDAGSTWDELATPAADATSYPDVTAADGTDYTYRVSACNAGGCTPSTTTASTPVAAPSDLAASTVSDTRIDLSWTDNSGAETAYELDWRVDGGTTWTTVDLGSNVESYSHTGRTPNTLYEYRVRACDGAECSDYDGVVSASTDATPAPAAPGALAASGVSPTQVNLSWSDVATETGYLVERSAGAGYTTIGTPAANATSFNDTGAADGTDYTYRVSACNAGGCTPSTTTASTPVAPPSDLAASTVSDTRIDLSWTDNSGAETAYELDWRESGGTFATLDLGSNVESYQHTGRTPNTLYEYRVRACAGAECSDYAGVVSASTDATPAPAAPGALAASVVSPTQVNLSWTDVATEDNYLVERSDDAGYTTIGTPAANATSFNDTGAADGTDYTYRVSACNAGGCTPATTTASTPVAPPTDLAASTVSDTRIDLSWTDNSGAETAYELDWRESGGTFATIDLGANVESYQHTGRTPSTTYEYQIRACDGVECSTYDGIVSATTEAAPTPAPDAPTPLTASVVSPTQVDLTWTDVATETGYTVERSDDAGATWTEIATPAADVTAYSDTDATEGTDYTYRVSACNDGGCTPVTTTASTPPVAPTGLEASAVSDTEIDLTWTGNSAAETSYEVERSEDDGVSFNLVASPAAESYTDTGLTASTTYEYRVRACTTSVCSEYSTIDIATTLAGP